MHVVEHGKERMGAPRRLGFEGRFAGGKGRRATERERALSFHGNLRDAYGCANSHLGESRKRNRGGDTIGTLGGTKKGKLRPASIPEHNDRCGI